MSRRSIDLINWNHPNKRQTSGYTKTGFVHPPTKSYGKRGKLPVRILKSSEQLPESFAWHPDTLTEIRDQGQCGSCWAFAISTALADRIMIQSRGDVNVPLSPQHLMNCVVIAGGGPPCGGNDIETALSTIPPDGLLPESVQPYRMINGGNSIFPCVIDKNVKDYDVKVPLQGSYCLTTSSRAESIVNMKSHIFHEGPIVGCMLEVFPDLADYDGVSIYEPAQGQESEGGHAIEILGWGKNPEGTEYWICRNSWGPQWPMNHLEGMGMGWFYVKLGDNVCRMEEIAYATVPNMYNRANAPTIDVNDAYSYQGVPGTPTFTPTGYQVSYPRNEWILIFQIVMYVVIGLIIYRIVTQRKR